MVYKYLVVVLNKNKDIVFSEGHHTHTEAELVADTLKQTLKEKGIDYTVHVYRKID